MVVKVGTETSILDSLFEDPLLATGRVKTSAQLYEALSYSDTLDTEEKVHEDEEEYPLRGNNSPSFSEEILLQLEDSRDLQQIGICKLFVGPVGEPLPHSQGATSPSHHQHTYLMPGTSFASGSSYLGKKNVIKSIVDGYMQGKEYKILHTEQSLTSKRITPVVMKKVGSNALCAFHCRRIKVGWKESSCEYEQFFHFLFDEEQLFDAESGQYMFEVWSTATALKGSREKKNGNRAKSEKDSDTKRRRNPRKQSQRDSGKKHKSASSLDSNSSGSDTSASNDTYSPKSVTVRKAETAEIHRESERWPKSDNKSDGKHSIERGKDTTLQERFRNLQVEDRSMKKDLERGLYQSNSSGSGIACPGFCTCGMYQNTNLSARLSTLKIKEKVSGLETEVDAKPIPESRKVASRSTEDSKQGETTGLQAPRDSTLDAGQKVLVSDSFNLDGHTSLDGTSTLQLSSTGLQAPLDSTLDAAQRVLVSDSFNLDGHTGSDGTSTLQLSSPIVLLATSYWSEWEEIILLGNAIDQYIARRERERESENNICRIWEEVSYNYNRDIKNLHIASKQRDVTELRLHLRVMKRRFVVEKELDLLKMRYVKCLSKFKYANRNWPKSQSLLDWVSEESLTTHRFLQISFNHNKLRLFNRHMNSRKLVPLLRDYLSHGLGCTDLRESRPWNEINSGFLKTTFRYFAGSGYKELYMLFRLLLQSYQGRHETIGQPPHSCRYSARAKALASFVETPLFHLVLRRSRTTRVKFYFQVQKLLVDIFHSVFCKSNEIEFNPGSDSPNVKSKMEQENHARTGIRQKPSASLARSSVCHQHPSLNVGTRNNRKWAELEDIILVGVVFDSLFSQGLLRKDTKTKGYWELLQHGFLAMLDNYWHLNHTCGSLRSEARIQPDKGSSMYPRSWINRCQHVHSFTASERLKWKGAFRKLLFLSRIFWLLTYNNIRSD